MEKQTSDIDYKRESYVLELISKAQSDNEEGKRALEELYGCANGGDPTARRFVNLQDQRLQTTDKASV